MREYLKKYKISEYDFSLVAMIIGTNIFGIMVVTSAFPDKKIPMIAGMILGVAIMIFLSVVDYTFILKFYWCFYIANLVLLALIFTPMGKTINGSRRWLQLASLTPFQPSEGAKILLILFFAQFIMKYKDKIKDIRFVFTCLVLAGIPIILIFKQPDLSTCIMIFVTFACMLFVAGMDWRLVAVALAISVPAVIFVIMDAINGWGIIFGRILKSYQKKRILAWLHPEDFTADDAYQTLHSLMAIGSGGIGGKGSEDLSSVLNAGFISEPQSDFVFAVIGEKFGFIGGCFVICILLVITVRCLMISFRAKDKAGQLLAAGIGAWIGFQGFINISVVTGLFPNTGLPLPFISAGTSAILSMYAGMGVVLNVRLQSNKYI